MQRSPLPLDSCSALRCAFNPLFLSPAKKPFRLKEDKVLYFTASRILLKEFGQAALNGISELFSNCASSLISILYNYQLMRFAGEDGVAVYGT